MHDTKQYRWCLIFGSAMDQTWIQCRTIPVMESFRANMIIRYDPKTMESLVTKNRWGADNCTLEEAIAGEYFRDSEEP